MKFICKNFDETSLKVLATWRQGAHYLIANLFKDSWMIQKPLAALKGVMVPPPEGEASSVAASVEVSLQAVALTTILKRLDQVSHDGAAWLDMCRTGRDVSLKESDSDV